jgi:hypothetical protein
MNNQNRIVYLIKAIKWVLLFILLFAVGKVIYQFVKTSPCRYHFIADHGERCINVFKDSISKDLKCIYSFGNSNGALYAYVYIGKYRFIVWELDDFQSVDLKKIRVVSTTDPVNIKDDLHSVVTLGGGPSVEINDIQCFDMNESMILDIREGGNLSIDTITPKYFIAKCELNEFVISNNYYKNQLQFSFEILPTFCILSLIKKNNTFYNEAE